MQRYLSTPEQIVIGIAEIGCSRDEFREKTEFDEATATDIWLGAMGRIGAEHAVALENAFPTYFRAEILMVNQAKWEVQTYKMTMGNDVLKAY